MSTPILMIDRAFRMEKRQRWVFSFYLEDMSPEFKIKPGDDIDIELDGIVQHVHVSGIEIPNRKNMMVGPPDWNKTLACIWVNDIINKDGE